MDHAGVKPGDIRHPQDLSRLPIVTKRMLRSGYPHLTTRNTGMKTFEVSSSGSTGTNFYVKEDPATAGWHRASFLLAVEWAGWQIGEPHLQTGMTLSAAGIDGSRTSCFSVTMSPHSILMMLALISHSICLKATPFSIYGISGVVSTSSRVGLKKEAGTHRYVRSSPGAIACTHPIEALLSHLLRRGVFDTLWVR